MALTSPGRGRRDDRKESVAAGETGSQGLVGPGEQPPQGPRTVPHDGAPPRFRTSGKPCQPRARRRDRRSPHSPGDRAHPDCRGTEPCSVPPGSTVLRESDACHSDKTATTGQSPGPMNDGDAPVPRTAPQEAHTAHARRDLHRSRRQGAPVLSAAATRAT